MSDESWKFFGYTVIDNKSPLVKEMTWCWEDDKSLPPPMMTQFTDVYMHHQTPML